MVSTKHIPEKFYTYVLSSPYHLYVRFHLEQPGRGKIVVVVNGVSCSSSDSIIDSALYFLILWTLGKFPGHWNKNIDRTFNIGEI